MAPALSIICLSITASSPAKRAPAKHTSKTQSSISASLLRLGNVLLHNAPASLRRMGVQSSSDNPTSFSAGRVFDNRDSEPCNFVPIRRRMRSAVSSSPSPLKFPQCPSWPPGSGRMVSTTSKCPGHRFTVSRTPKGKLTSRLLSVMPPRPGSM
uniref:Uncharacterized protein n=1 Tax=Alexandrium monilatum TaxID=311494 RepID=A0A7S4SIH7_9DINO